MVTESGIRKCVTLGLGVGLVVFSVVLLLRIGRPPGFEPPTEDTHETTETEATPALEPPRSSGTTRKSTEQVIQGTVWSAEDVDLILGDGGSISGKVVGEDVEYTPEILSNVRSVDQFVNLAHSDLERLKERPFEGVEVTLKGTGTIRFERTTTTNAYGHYLFDELPPASFSISLKRPTEAVVDNEVAARRVTLRHPGAMHIENIDFRFRVDGLSITGHVSDTQGRPLSGAEIAVETLWEKEPGAGGAEVVGATKTSSDDHGNYHVNGLRRMNLKNAQLFESYGLASVRHVVRVRMKGYESAGIVVPAITEDLARSASALRLTADHFGLAGSANLRPGTLPEARGRVISRVDFVLAKGSAVTGTLVNRQGIAVANRPIYLDPSNPENLRESDATRPFLSKVTDVSGQFSFEGLPSDAYTFYVYAHSRLYADNEPLRLSAGDSVRDYIVTIEGNEDRGEIVGRVLDARRSVPLSQFKVSVLNFEEIPLGSAGQKGEIIMPDAADGTFLVSGISPGLVALRVDAEGYGPAIQHVEVWPGMSTEVTVLMPAAGDIYGYVTFNGEPSEMAVVRVYSKEGEPYLEQYQPDETGYYQTSDLGTGSYLVIVEFQLPPRSTKRRSAQWVTVDADHASRADFAVEGTASLSGILSYPSSRKYGFVAVREMKWRDTPLPINDWPMFESHVMAHVFCWEEGAYSVDALPPGDFFVTAVCYNPSDDQVGKRVDIIEASHEIHIEPGESVSLDFDLW